MLPPPSPPRSAARPPPSTSAEPNCTCGVPAAQRTVTKESMNKGRQFWTCGASRACDFFEWCDGPSSAAAGPSTSVSRMAPPSTVPTKRAYTTSASQANEGAGRRCGCEMPAVQKTVFKEGANQGRQFWTCSKGEAERCKFFEWDDEPPRVSGGGGGGSGGGGGASDECYKVRHLYND
jgi:DNA topoisomerase-3